MQHFSSEQWVDFVRNVLAGKDRTAMEAHLKSGCKRCSAALSKWMRVREAAARERGYKPPENAVRRVKGLLALHSSPSRAPIAQLLFDSLRTPAFAGLRSATSAARQMLYAIGDLRIDLRIEPKAHTGRASLVGQVLVSSDPARPAVGIPVMLVEGPKTVAALQTNEFGEFDLECDRGTHLQLRFVLPPQVEVSVPLQDELGNVSVGSEKSAVRVGRSKKKTKTKSTRKKVRTQGS
jgi:hypothetical protein